MTATTIETRYSFSEDEVDALMDAVFTAEVDTLDVGDEQRNVRYTQHEAAHFDGPPGAGSRLIHIEVTLVAGHTVSEKRELFDEIIHRLADLGHSPAEISILLHEQPEENWFLGVRQGPGRGGMLTWPEE